MTLDPLVYENVCVITSLPTKRIQRYRSENISKSFTHKMARRKPAGTEITSLLPYV